jgi:hypothetical protein
MLVTLFISSGNLMIFQTLLLVIILRIKVIRPSGVLELQRANGCTIWGHSKKCVPCHLPNLDPTIITSTWIPPLGFLHLIIHVRYIEGQTMLMRCCFAIIVMVDTIYSTSSWNSLKFPSAFGTIHHVLL